jgi:hypothetical protein
MERFATPGGAAKSEELILIATNLLHPATYNRVLLLKQPFLLAAQISQ